jgi:hypothetical protein
MKKFSAYLILPLFALAFALNAHSALISVAGPKSSAGTSPLLIMPPLQVLDDDVTSSSMLGYNENRIITTVDHVIDGSGAIPKGTAVDSHMIFLNSGGGGLLTHYSVVWTFAAPILGVMSDKGGSLEDDSTFELGSPATIYPAAPFGSRGLEMLGNPANDDGYSISGDRLSITVGMEVTQPGDWIRVVTHVPIPGAVWLLGSGLVGLVLLRRRMKA